MHGLGEPHDGDEKQNGQPFVDVGIIRQYPIKRGAKNGRDDGKVVKLLVLAVCIIEGGGNLDTKNSRC